MRHTRLDAHTAEGLLTGALTADDAPPGYSGVASLLGSARSAGVGAPSADSMSLPGEAPTIGAMLAALAVHDAPAVEGHRSKRSSLPAKVVSLKAAVVVSAVLLSGGTAAAATGSLPGAAQTTASEVLHDVGISVPGASTDRDGHGDAQAAAADHGKGDEGHESSSTARDPDESSSAGATKVSTSKDEGKGPKSHALFGLCTARNANDGHAHSDVFPSAATCASVTHPGKGDGHDQASESSGSSTDQPEGPPTPKPGGQPSTTPGSDEAPVQTPNEGTAADTAPNGHGPGANESHGDAASSGAPNGKGAH